MKITINKSLCLVKILAFHPSEPVGKWAWILAGVLCFVTLLLFSLSQFDVNSTRDSLLFQKILLSIRPAKN